MPANRHAYVFNVVGQNGAPSATILRRSADILLIRYVRREKFAYLVAWLVFAIIPTGGRFICISVDDSALVPAIEMPCF